jgi:hypothetical protein
MEDIVAEPEFPRTPDLASLFQDREISFQRDPAKHYDELHAGHYRQFTQKKISARA